MDLWQGLPWFQLATVATNIFIAFIMVRVNLEIAKLRAHMYERFISKADFFELMRRNKNG